MDIQERAFIMASIQLRLDAEEKAVKR